MVAPRKVRKRVSQLKPSPENGCIYERSSDVEIRDLASEIKNEGLREPLVITLDDYVLSGHRRLAALNMTDIKQVYCFVVPIERALTDKGDYLKLLRKYNKHQRDKSLVEKIREEAVDMNPEVAYQELIAARRVGLESADFMAIEGQSKRNKISDEKLEHVKFIKKVIMEDRKDFWPLTSRYCHYGLLVHEFHRNTAKKIPYANDLKSYKATCNLLTRLRLNGEIPWSACRDETRSLVKWRVWPDARVYANECLSQLFTDYFRDLMNSQPHYIQVVCEKDASFKIVADVTEKYCMPSMSARGYSGIDTWHETSVDFFKSGKDNLILVLLTDYDPEGFSICQSAGRVLRDDFGIKNTRIIKAGVTAKQVKKYKLPSHNKVKMTSSLAKSFIKRHGESVYELEALDPSDLQKELTDILDSLIDVKLFNAELEKEKEEAAFLKAVSKATSDLMLTEIERIWSSLECR